MRGGGRRAGGAYLVEIVPSFTTTRAARTTESSHLTKDGLDVGLAIKKHFGRPKTPDFVLILPSVPVQHNVVPPLFLATLAAPPQPCGSHAIAPRLAKTMYKRRALLR